MSKRIDKKKQKKLNVVNSAANTPVQSSPVSASAAPVAAPAAPVVTPAEDVDFFIQFQNQEYLEKEVIAKIKEKCSAEGKEVTGAEKLSVYLKPEDNKAYFTYAGISSFIEL